MADLSKLKRRTTLGTPPPLDDASQSLIAPEVAPAGVFPPDAPVTAIRRPPVGGNARHVGYQRPDRIDGRSLRKTGRTLQLATRVSWEFDQRLREVAQRDRLKLVELLERGLDAYEAAREGAAGRWKSNG
jgi:hypothetical protein